MCVCLVGPRRSVLRGEDKQGSDLDLLVDPRPQATLFSIGAIHHELLQLFADSRLKRKAGFPCFVAGS